MAARELRYIPGGAETPLAFCERAISRHCETSVLVSEVMRVRESPDLQWLASVDWWLGEEFPAPCCEGPCAHEAEAAPRFSRYLVGQDGLVSEWTEAGALRPEAQ